MATAHSTVKARAGRNPPLKTRTPKAANRAKVPARRKTPSAPTPHAQDLTTPGRPGSEVAGRGTRIRVRGRLQEMIQAELRNLGRAESVLRCLALSMDYEPLDPESPYYEELKNLVEGLPAQALFHEGAERMLASVRGIVGSYLAPYSYLPEDAGAKSWSIRRHVREGKGWLWLSYREDQAAALRPLLAAWIGEAVNATLSLPADRVRRRWLMLDEVASLGRVQSLSDALTKGRKYGLCSIMGLQSVSQLRDVYGKDGAQTLLSCLSSQLILRANDPETAEYASQHLGECEVLRESIAKGKHRTVTEQRHVERLVLGSEIQGLANRIGYLRLSGQDIVRRVKIPLIKREKNVEPFVAAKPKIEALPPPAPTSSPPPSAPPALDADAILGKRAPQ